MSSVWPSSLLDNGGPPTAASNGVDSSGGGATLKTLIVSDAEKQAKQRRTIAGRVGASITFSSTIPPSGYSPAIASPPITGKKRPQHPKMQAHSLNRVPWAAPSYRMGASPPSMGALPRLILAWAVVRLGWALLRLVWARLRLGWVLHHSPWRSAAPPERPSCSIAPFQIQGLLHPRKIQLSHRSKRLYRQHFRTDERLGGRLQRHA